MNLFLAALLAVTLVQKPLSVVPVDSLRAMLPEAEGWTRGDIASDVVRVSDDAGYSFVTAQYANGGAKIRLTIGDTVGASDCLLALAAMISVLPQGSSENPNPATTIARFTYEGYEAASKWNSVKLAGEFSVLVEGRFVVKAEGEGIDTLDTLRAFASKVDFKKLAQLKPAK
jgi:hypothetical protein